MNTALRLFLILVLAFPSSLNSFTHAPGQSASASAATTASSLRLFSPGGFRPWFSGEAPTAVDDTYTTDEDTQLVIAAPGILENDADLETDPLTAVLDVDAAHGDLALAPGGSFVYTPDPNYSGFDSFTYYANDSTANSLTPAVVTIEINPVNDAPSAAADSYATNEDVVLSVPAPGVLSNDQEFDGESITAALVSGPTRGQLTLNPNGSFIYTPTANLNGSDSFTYTATDGTLTSQPATTVTINVNAVNDPPVAVNDTYTVQEDASLSVPAASGVLINDTDVETSAQTAVLVDGTTSGILTFNSTGAFTYTPNPNFSGTDSFTYRANDGSTNSTNPATVTINVTPQDDRPVANNDSYTVTEDTPFTPPAPGVLGNDTDIDTLPAALTAVLGVGPTRGTLSLQSNGSFTYTPNANVSGADSFTYFANDGSTNSVAAATVSLNVTAVNDLPVVVNDTFSTPEDTPMTVAAAAGVLANDTDVEGSSLTASLVQGPASGSLQLNSDGSFSYTPSLNFNGPVTFTYNASDGSASSAAPAVVTINVIAANDRPLVTNDAYSTAEDSALTVAPPGILVNDSDPDADPITAVLVTNPSSGTLTAFNANGSFTYTPNPNFAGTDSFTYRSSDSTLPSEAVGTVTITVNPVNDRPVAVNDSYTAVEDTLFNSPTSVLANDTDVDTTGITAVLLAAPLHGQLTLNQDGTFSYTPDLNYNGSDSFTYNANDGEFSSTAPATVAISITAVNDRPVAVGESYNIDEDVPLIVAAPGLLANDTDVEGSSLTAVIADGPASGALVLNANGSFTYTPNLNFNGSDSFTYNANDSNLISAAPAVVSITVAPVNDRPVAVNDSYTTAEDTALALFEDSVLDNDTDPELDPLTAVVQTPPANGTLTLYTNGTFTYTPNLNFHGTDTFTYNIQDAVLTSAAPATVTITVTPANDRPLNADDIASVAEDAVLTVAAPGVLANDNDIDGDPLTAVLAAGPTNGALTLQSSGAYTYTPNADFYGTDTFTYHSSDALSTSAVAATVTITVTAVNDAPVAVANAYDAVEDTPLTVAAPGVLANDTDVDGDAVTAVPVDPPANGTLTLNTDGSFMYTPALNFHGTDTFTYRARDGSANSVLAATVTITVADSNDLPVAVANNYPTPEDTPLTIAAPGVLANDTDIDGDTLTAALAVGPANGALNLLPTGEFTYTPALNFNGTDSFTYTASDGTGASNTAAVTITVSAVNDAPVGTPDTYLAFDEDTVLTVAQPEGVLANDTDVDSTTLTAQVRTTPQHGTLNLNANGSFTYTPAADYNGPDSFVYRVSDSTLTSADTLVSLTINPVNDAPVATAASATTLEDTPAAVTLTGTDLETPAGLTFSIITQPAHGTLTGTPPSLTYTPALNYNTTDSFTFQAQDPGTLLSNIATFTITITAVNDAPVAVDDPSYTIAEDNPLTVALPGVLQNDTDVEGSSLRAVISVQPQHGTLTLNSNGSFTYTPALNYNGPDTFRYFANDTQLNSAVAATATINVTPVNDAPVAVADTATTAEDTPINLTTGGVLVNDSDVDADPLTAAVVATTQHGTLTLQPNGRYTYTPALNYNGPDSFTYRVSDGTLTSNTVTVAITITPVNDAPHTTPKFYTVAVDGVLEVHANDPDNPPGLLDDADDVENNPFSAEIVTQPLYGTLTVLANGSFTYYANHSVVTDDSFTFRACENLTTPKFCGPVTNVVIDIVNPDNTIILSWVAPVTDNRRWYGGTEDITLQVNISNCPGCGVRYYRWDNPTQSYLELATTGEDTTYTFSTSILNTGPGRFDGWNQIIANAVLPSGGLASQRAYIWLVRMPYAGPAQRKYFPLGAGK